MLHLVKHDGQEIVDGSHKSLVARLKDGEVAVLKFQYYVAAVRLLLARVVTGESVTKSLWRCEAVAYRSITATRSSPG